MSVQHTPGPWKWFGNRSGGLYLATTHSGRKYVMGFRRYGMNGAQPVFRCADRMVPAAELVEFEVGDGTARGFKEADKNPSVYRYDVSAIDNPDARLIAEAPTMAEALRGFVEHPLPYCETDAEKLARLDEFMRMVRSQARAILARIDGDEA